MTRGDDERRTRLQENGERALQRAEDAADIAAASARHLGGHPSGAIALGTLVPTLRTRLGAVTRHDGTRWPAYEITHLGRRHYGTAGSGVFIERGGRALQQWFEQGVAMEGVPPLPDWQTLSDDEKAAFLSEGGWGIVKVPTGNPNGRPAKPGATERAAIVRLIRAERPRYSIEEMAESVAAISGGRRGRTPPHLKPQRKELARVLATIRMREGRKLNAEAVAHLLCCGTQTIYRLEREGAKEVKNNPPNSEGTRTRASDCWAFRRWDRAVDPDNPLRYIYSPPSQAEVVQLPTRLDSSVADAA